MYKDLIIGIALSILGLYLIFNSKQYGKETMDSYRNFYRSFGLKKIAKSVTKQDEKEESKVGLVGGIVVLIIGIYEILIFISPF